VPESHHIEEKWTVNQAETNPITPIQETRRHPYRDNRWQYRWGRRRDVHSTLYEAR